MPAKMRTDLRGAPRPRVDAAGCLGSARYEAETALAALPPAMDLSASQFMNCAKWCRNRCRWVFWPLRRLGGRPPDPNMVMRRAEMRGCGVRRYAGRMACLVPQHMVLEEVVHAFKGIDISSIALQHVS